LRHETKERFGIANYSAHEGRASVFQFECTSMVYIEVVEDWFGNSVSLLITNSPTERDGVREREREREMRL